MSGEIPLARLLAMAFRQQIEALHQRLAERGWPDVRPPYGFVLLAIRDGARAAGELTELLGTTKQATSQLLDAMERDGLLERAPDPADARHKHIAITPNGRRLLADVEAIYVELESAWAEHLGAERVEALRAALHQVLLASNAGQLPPIRPVW